jgi:hypothetical protein
MACRADAADFEISPPSRPRHFVSSLDGWLRCRQALKITLVTFCDKLRPALSSESSNLNRL